MLGLIMMGLPLGLAVGLSTVAVIGADRGDPAGSVKGEASAGGQRTPRAPRVSRRPIREVSCE